MIEKLFTLKELEDMPLPEWLVTDLLIENTFAVLVGEPGVGKSFLALDWAMSICHAKDWQGKGTKYGPVAYIVAEGAAPAHVLVAQRPRLKRWRATEIDAWMDEYGRPVDKAKTTTPDPGQIPMFPDKDATLVGEEDEAEHGEDNPVID